MVLSQNWFLRFPQGFKEAVQYEKKEKTLDTGATSDEILCVDH